MSSVIPLGRAIRTFAAEDPERPVVTVGDRALTWSELDQESDRLAHVLAGLGVAQGSGVAIVLPNGLSFEIGITAAWKLGATPQLLSPRMPPAELQELLELAKPSAVLAVGDLDAPAPVVDPARITGTDTHLARANPDVVAPRWLATASGGSTGRPKLVIAEQNGLVGPDTDIDHAIHGYRIDRDTTIVLPGPLCHAGPFGLNTYTMFARGHVVALERFDPEETLAAVERHRATMLFVVPTMMNRIHQLPRAVRERYDLSSLEIVWHAAAPCPAWLKEAWIDWLGPERIHESYGASDSAAITRIDGVDWLTHRGSVGPVAFGELAIFDQDFNQLPPGEVGDIYMRPPPGAMRRTYLGAPAPTVRDGWSTVGDMGWVDDEGYLYLADRRVDLIITGGLNVYPAEVEGAIDAHPKVISSAVVGIPDDDLGKRVHAVVQVSSELDVDELRAFVRERLSGYKVPRTIEITDEPVRDEAGKVRRSAIAARVVAGGLA